CRGDDLGAGDGERPGQTFALIEGPVEFPMASPACRPGRIAEEEVLHRRSIPRRFAIATEEVTVEQCLQSARDNPSALLNKSDQRGTVAGLPGPNRRCLLPRRGETDQPRATPPTRSPRAGSITRQLV